MNPQQLADEIKRIGGLNLSDTHVCDNGLCVDVEHMTAACKLVKHLHAELVAAHGALYVAKDMYFLGCMREAASGEAGYELAEDGRKNNELIRGCLTRLAPLAELKME